MVQVVTIGSLVWGGEQIQNYEGQTKAPTKNGAFLDVDSINSSEGTHPQPESITGSSGSVESWKSEDKILDRGYMDSSQSPPLHMVRIPKNWETLQQTAVEVFLTEPLSHRVVLRSVLPVYPDWAKKQRIKALAKFYFSVSPDGNVTSIRMIKTSSYSALDVEAEAALKQWKFAPLGSTNENKSQWGFSTFFFAPSQRNYGSCPKSVISVREGAATSRSSDRSLQ